MGSRITIVGAGYVGLTTGACFAHLGHTVTCADIDVERVAALNRGEIPILEAGLENLVREGVNGGRLTFVVGAAEPCSQSEFVYLCVPTPQGDDGSADLSYIESAAREIGPTLQPDTVVINKSTVPVGSTRVVEQALGRGDVVVVSNPEFLREGTAVHDFLHPDRIVIGADDQSAAIRVASLYLNIAAPVIVTDPPSAELIKYASNAFLAAKVSFVNAIAAVCEAVGADMNDVVLGMGYDKRIGSEFLRPGPGWGGSCFVGDETVLVRRDGGIRLLSFASLWAEVEAVGSSGWEVLSWRDGAVNPEFERVERFTARPYHGDVVDVRTKMGRRITVTADHPMVVGDGRSGRTGDRLAGELTPADWIPIAQGFPLVVDDKGFGSVRAAVDEARRAHRVPDQVWAAPEAYKRAFLRALWHGEVNVESDPIRLLRSRPAVAHTAAERAGARQPDLNATGKVARDQLDDRVLEYGTVSRALADGMVRLLGDLGIVARLKVGRTPKSTVDTYWLCISGADQDEDALWLFPEAEQAEIRTLVALQDKRIAPTGYRRLDDKGVAWARVTSAQRRRYDGTVYSLEVPSTHTAVSTYGTVSHNCFPKDSRALIRIAEDAGYDFDLLRGVVSVNEEQMHRIVAKVHDMVGGSLDGVRLAAWGLTFKARTDDLRESPALAIIGALREQGAIVRAFDPSAVPPLDPRREGILEGIEVSADPYAACEDAEVLLVLTEWDEFRWLDFDKVASAMATPRVVDGRNLLDREALRRRGFAYQGVGRI